MGRNSLSGDVRAVEFPFAKNMTTVRVAHMHVDKHGFVWINLDSSSKPQVSWQDQASCIDAMEKFKGFSPSDYTYSHSWSIGGDFDWKTFVDYHFNEIFTLKSTDIKPVAAKNFWTWKII
ncbi:hypothetical protein KEM54_003022 [Ascosphaera aggregata]|nr:hypothetical protein KEM54_003022 [Ascosphaera aggregata]